MLKLQRVPDFTKFKQRLITVLGLKQLRAYISLNYARKHAIAK